MTRGELFAAKMISVDSERRIARQRRAAGLENQRGIREEMKDLDVFWKLEALSDRQLIERVGSIFGSSRRLMAELLAHLGEVEERRLHLAAACSSMFAYCLKLGMTEDEAYRRIEVARLARRYPAIFPLLATGQLTISVVALVKQHLSNDNHQELLAALTGKSVMQTRELIAARFPRPDVPTSVRKLPERRTVTPTSLRVSMWEEPRAKGADPCGNGMDRPGAETEPGNGGAEPRGAETEPCTHGTESRGAETESRKGRTQPRADGMHRRVAETESRTRGMQPCGAETALRTHGPKPYGAGTEPHIEVTQRSQSERAAPPRVSSRVEPLSAQRYKVQFTASAELARKLELARDLMRHAHPGGELGPVVERALDLLIESLMQRRFGRSKKTSPRRPRERANLGQREDVMADGFPTQHTEQCGAAERAPAIDITAVPDTPEPETRATAELDTPATAKPDTHASTEPARATWTLADASAHNIAMHGAADLDSPTTFGVANIDSECRAEREPRPDPDVRPDGERVSPSYIPRFTRRTVVERDGLGCSWVDEQGERCGSRAWLEYDHLHPRAKGGRSEPGNLRLLCRQHNRFAAEREFGRPHVEKHIAERRRGRAPQAHAI